LRQVMDFLSGDKPVERNGHVTTTSSQKDRSHAAERQPDQVAATVLEAVAEKTGFPVEMLGLDMEMDADLGIDSIKRVEIMSVLQERLPHAPSIKSEHLGALRKLRQVAEFLSGFSASATVNGDLPVPSTDRQEDRALVQVQSETASKPLYRYI